MRVFFRHLSFLLLFVLVVPFLVMAQQEKDVYKSAFQEQLIMLQGKSPMDFKKSVFITENAYFGGRLNYGAFCDSIKQIGTRLNQMIHDKGFDQYKTAGNWAVFMYMTDTSDINYKRPFTYDFDDFMGNDDYSKMFVTKLMNTGSGNCHSMPMLYKILADEIGAPASLALAPNHLYIKHLDESGEWANVELTNGGFPRDQWIIQQMGISIDAIKSEIYMTPLTPTQTIALTMFDLASGYKFQFGYDDFVSNIIDTAIHYFPNCIPLLALKADYYESIGQVEKKQAIIKSMYDLGYREMPLEEYENWVSSVEQEKAKRTDVK